MSKFSIAFLVLLFSSAGFGQTPELLNWAKTHGGKALYTRFGVHNGNRVAISFRSDGSISGTNANDIRGEWPYPATHDSYIGDVTPLVGIEIPISDYTGDGIPDTLHSVTISPGPRNGQSNKVDPNTGQFQGFEPEPGYVNLNQDTVAMSHIPSSWPSIWPDHPDWIVPGTGKSYWDGYFGKGVNNADQESYFVMDDAQDNSVQQRTHYLFHPDSTDTSRSGMGLVVAVRGFQWSQIQAQDVIFYLYDITNIGTTNYSKADFGLIIGGCVGGYDNDLNDLGNVCKDNLAYFDLNNNLTYTWQANDNVYEVRFTPISQVLPGVRNSIGYAAYSYLESPGNPYDAIDNNNSSEEPNAPVFSENDFTFNSSTASYLATRTLHRTDDGKNPNFPSDKIVLITLTPEIITGGTQTPFQVIRYERQVVLLDTLLRSAADTETVYSQGIPYRIYDGEVLADIPNNGYDDNLNGIIDENHDLHYQRIFRDANGNVIKQDTRPLAYANYVTGAGTDNTMVDEARDSGPGHVVTGYVPDYTQPRDLSTGKYPPAMKSHWSGDENGNWNPNFDDVGADGVPHTGDFGEGDGIPTEGEPHFDQTDVNESDQLGLTSFNFFNQSESPDMSKSEVLWNRMIPGYFDVIPQTPMDGDFIFASGYFPLPSLHTERFSMALVFGPDSSTVFENKQVVQQIYDNNYNFTKPPYKPTLTAIPGDKKVTLLWNSIAESFVDNTIQDTTKQHTFEGYKVYRSTDPGFTEGDGQAIATFDLVDQVRGYFLPQTQALAALPKFYLGNDVGLVHTYVDSGLQNGEGYFYAVTAYTKGDAGNSVYPAETPKFVTIDAQGIAHPDINVAYVVPQAPSAGYNAPGTPNVLSAVPGTTLTGTGTVSLNVANPRAVFNKTYRVTFSDTLANFVPSTTGYYVVDYTDSLSPDTLVKAQLVQNETVGTFDNYLFDGMYITVNNSWSVSPIDTLSGWNRNYALPNYTFKGPIPLPANNIPNTMDVGVAYPEDYIIVFDSTLSDTTTAFSFHTKSGGLLLAPRIAVNFRVYDAHTHEPIGFVFSPGTSTKYRPLGFVVANSQVILLKNVKTASGADSAITTWFYTFSGADSTRHIPSVGDTLLLYTSKPFSSADVFQAKTQAQGVNNKLGASQLANIRVVPNPYIAATTQEQPLPPGINSGRGTRKISFIHLPPRSTIYIFTSRGELVKKIIMPSGQDIADGTVDWDLRTDANLDVAFGVYFYLVDAPGVGQKYGKIAIIK
ncbi:MAG TPA: hypothetical protein VLX91_02925 [Candidatus Acidoferrales bacterium]|nr:hypothetical protein [Candidatus Acidoferrales bacterium]